MDSSGPAPSAQSLPQDANIDSRQPWLTSLYVPIGSRLIPLPVLSFLLPSNSTLAQHKRRDSHGRRPTPFSFGVIAYVAVTVVLVVAPFVAVAILWTVFKARRSTLVVTRTELQRIWRYEIASGHYPSTRRPDLSISSTQAELNPGIESGIHAAGSIFGIGQKRTYRTLPLNKLSSTDLRTMPPRPARGSALDLDVVLNHCDFSTGKYVRDCLEFLRINGGLQGSQVRRGKLHAWRATYFTDGASSSQSQPHGHDAAHSIFGSSSEHVDAHILERRQRTLSSRASQSLAPITPHPSNPTADPICDPDYPRIFHIWWSGPFTDKPYAAALSFLYTQNVRLDRPIDSPPPADTCRPQLWIWINPGPASSLPVEGAGEALRRELAQNMWSAPLLHSRFEDVLKFQLWNTSEQLDGVEEMHGWRSRPLFQSHGKKYAVRPPRCCGQWRHWRLAHLAAFADAAEGRYQLKQALFACRIVNIKRLRPSLGRLERYGEIRADSPIRWRLPRRRHVIAARLGGAIRVARRVRLSMVSFAAVQHCSAEDAARKLARQLDLQDGRRQQYGLPSDDTGALYA